MLIEKKKDYAPAHQTAATLYSVAAHRLFEEMTQVDAAVRRVRREGRIPGACSKPQANLPALSDKQQGRSRAVRSTRKKTLREI